MNYGIVTAKHCQWHWMIGDEGNRPVIFQLTDLKFRLKKSLFKIVLPYFFDVYMFGMSFYIIFGTKKSIRYY